MNNVYFPAQVVVLFRRIFNVFSGLSISNQYLLKHSKETLKDGEQEQQQVNDTARAIWSWEGPWKRGAMSDTLHLREKPRNLSASTESTSTNELPQNSRNRFEPPPELPESSEPESKDTIHQLLSYPALYDPLCVPRNPIVLCHGLYGFDTRGPSTFPSMRMHYWANVLSILKGKLGAEVIITSVPGTGSISERADHLNRQLLEKARGREVNFMAHSMGGLDCRHLITHCKPEEYTPVSLTTISTPHRGSPFMDWCSDNLGLGKLAQEEKDLLTRASEEGLSSKSADGKKTRQPTFSSLSLSSLPSSFTTLLMSILDSPAYANLTSNYLNNVFNPATPDNPNVKYFSVAGRMPSVNVWHPFWLPKMVLDDFEEKQRGRLKEKWEQRDSKHLDRERPMWARQEEWGNDGLVTIQSAKWGEFLGTMEGCDHWELRGARGIEFGVDLPAIPAIGLGPPSSTTHESGRNNGGHQDGWNLKDWGWFLKAWQKEEKIHQEAASKAQTKGDRMKAREQERENDDAVVKASTDKLSVVFDWLTDRVPSPPLPLLGGSKPTASEKETQAFWNREQSQELDRKEGRKGKRNDLATKNDLERFYVALARKLYDEGL
ncbi:lipase 2 [Moniliophthora roreri MCA 2997]|uniref:Lipase 2 n=2 Tax=Moniliophthora roreri TaxID=221103 RepID=V2XKK6_MONRO|nr:lipase 2 [Moniliophthora roreri MCA 2997]